ncbi:MAG: hypothetical protein RPG89_03400 [Microcystis panniformis WG22]|nr:hypothetical protein [Microcystis panniformis WG22]
MVRSPKIDRWSSRSHIRERTLQDWRAATQCLRHRTGYEVKTVRQMTSSADWLAIVYFWIGQISKANSFR